MNKNIVLVAVVMLVVVGFVGGYTALHKPTGASVTSVHALLARYDKAQLLKESDLVVMAEVKDTQSALAPSVVNVGENDIVTNATLTISRKLYDPKNISRTDIVVQVLGGTIGNTTTEVEDSVPFEKGQHVLVFLKQKNDNIFTVVGWQQGKYTLDTNGKIGVGEMELTNLQNIFGGNRLVSDIESEIKSTAILPAVTSVKSPTDSSLPSKNANAEAQSVLDTAVVK